MTSYHAAEQSSKVTDFFMRLDPLCTARGELSKKEIQLLYYWLEDAHQHLKEESLFINMGFEQLITRLCRILYERTHSHRLICDYLNDNPTFMEYFFRNTKNNFDHFKGRELCNVFNGIGHLKVQPPEDWLEAWYAHTKKWMSFFNHIDFQNSIHGFFLLRHKPDNAWLSLWFCDSQLELRIMEPRIAASLLASIGTLQITPPKEWINEWLQSHTMLMNDTLSAQEVFALVNAFYIQDVRMYPKFCKEWFKVSLAFMDGTTGHYAAYALISVVYMGVAIPHEWLWAWQKRILSDFDAYYLREGEGYNFNSLVDIARILYALTLMQCNLSFALPILKKCNAYFKMKANRLFQQSADAPSFRKIMFALKYFRMIGFDMYLNPIDYVYHMEWLTSRDGIHPQSEEDVGNYLRMIFVDDLNENQEAYIEEICDCVDFFIPSRRLVIEVDGRSHYIDNKRNALTNVKTWMLENAGYHVKRLDAKSVWQRGDDYINEQLRTYINDERTIHNNDYLNKMYDSRSGKMLN